MCYVVILRRVIMLRKIYEVVLRRIHSTGRDVASKVRRYQVIVRSYVTCDSLKVWYGVATVSRIDSITGLFCKRAL